MILMVADQGETENRAADDQQRENRQYDLFHRVCRRRYQQRHERRHAGGQLLLQLLDAAHLEQGEGLFRSGRRFTVQLGQDVGFTGPAEALQLLRRPVKTLRGIEGRRVRGHLRADERGEAADFRL